MNAATERPYRVLVVDDDAAIRRAYQEIFVSVPAMSSGLSALVGVSASSATEHDIFELSLADQGETAAQLHNSELQAGRPFQVAFIDMRMPPGWDGLRTALALRLQDPTIYIVISTAFADYDVAELQRALGHDVVLLRKPFSREEAYQLARTLCQSWYTRQRLERATADIERQVFARSTELDKRIIQQQALAEIATRCVEVDEDDDLGDAVHWSLARIGKISGADRASLIRLDHDAAGYSMNHEWRALGMPELRGHIQSLPVAAFRSSLLHLRREGHFRCNTLNDMPEELSGLRPILRGHVEAITSVPIMSGEELAGILSISAAQAGNPWDGYDEALLRTAGHLILRTLEVHEARQHLALSEANFRTLVQNIPGMVYRCALDAHWTIQFMSDYIETLSGYPVSDFIGNRVRSYASIIHPDDVEPVDRAVREAVANDAPYILDYRIIHADGRVRWVHERGQASKDENGNVAWLDGVITDVTKRKHIETALDATAKFVSAPGTERFSTELVRHAAVTLGLDYVHIAHLLPGNRQVETEAAWLDGEAIANWAYDLDCTPCAEVLRQSRRLIEADVQTRYPKDVDLIRVGAEGYVGEPIVDSHGKAVGLIVGVTRKPLEHGDMVQANLRILAARAGAEWAQREALKALRQERDTTRNILQTAEAIIVALDSSGRITLINRKGCELLGYSEAELIGRDWFTTCLPLAQGDAARSVFSKVMSADMAGFEYYENPILTRSGEERLIAWHNSGMHDADGRLVGGISAGMDITERRLAEDRLHASEERFRKLFDDADALAIQGYLQDGTVVYWNRASQRIYGYSAEEAIGGNLYDLIIPDALRNTVRTAVDKVFRTGQSEPPGRMLLHQKSGHLVPVYSSHTMVNAPGQATVMFGMDIDMSELDRAEAALNVALAKYKTLFDCFPMGITVTDLRGQVLETNAAAERLLGVSRAVHERRGIDSPEWRIVRPDGSPMPAADYASVRVLKERQRIENVEMGIVKDDGTTTWISVTADLLPLPDYGAVIAYGDITARREAEAKIRQPAYLDTLTGLANRRMLLDRLGQALVVSKRTGEHGALVMLDMDHFKYLNDSRGHDIGDKMLIEVAQRLLTSVRQADTVARLGGDEYVVMLEGLDSEAETAAKQAEVIVEKIRASLAQAYLLADHEPVYRSSASLGLSLFKGLDKSAETLLKQADLALYQAKAAGRDTLRFFNPEMQAAVERRMALEEALRQGLEHGDLRLYLQPQIDPAGGIIGAEALLRWQRSEKALLTPAEFMHEAEESDLILPIGRWVLDTACALINAWAAQPETGQLQLAVNISAREFQHADFVRRVRSSLARSGAVPNRLTLELAEATVLANVNQVLSKMRELKALGVRFSLDAFGTGLSSLSDMKRLPFDQLKIDPTFVRDTPQDDDNAALIRTIFALSRSLGLRVVAVGVETQAQLEFLRQLGCDAYQGFLLGPPIPTQAWGAVVRQADSVRPSC
jgi:diguanylate cyclase (GGDEF)-like protein/PAS domain S-box-containing protein